MRCSWCRRKRRLLISRRSGRPVCNSCYEKLDRELAALGARLGVAVWP